jgi:hypothetical protein
MAILPGLRYNGFLYLNDGDAENKPEYIAFMIDRMEGTVTIGREIGKIEPLGIELLQVKRSISEFGQAHWEHKFPLEVRVEPEWHHSCELCRFEEG